MLQDLEAASASFLGGKELNYLFYMINFWDQQRNPVRLRKMQMAVKISFKMWLIKDK